MSEGNTGQSVGYFLAAAELDFPAAIDAVGSGRLTDPLVAADNHRAGRVAKILFDSAHSFDRITQSEGPWKTYRLRCRTGGDSGVDLKKYDQLDIADYIELTDFDLERNRKPGIGAALVAHRKGTEERREANPFLSPVGMTLPVDAVLDSSRRGDGPDLKFSDSSLGESIVVGGRKLAVAADLSAALAVQVDYDIHQTHGSKAMAHPDDCAGHTGRYQLDPFRPDQIPVIFVHGLMSKPEIWLDGLNHLRTDPVLTSKYQLLVYRYPTCYNMAALRKQLEEIKKFYDPSGGNPNMRKMMLLARI